MKKWADSITDWTEMSFCSTQALAHHGHKWRQVGAAFVRQCSASTTAVGQESMVGESERMACMFDLNISDDKLIRCSKAWIIKLYLMLR